MNHEKTIKLFKIEVKKLSKKYKTILDFYSKLPILGYSRLEIMIIDSAIKNMPFENLHNTLLLKQDLFITMLQNLTKKIKAIKNQ